MAEEGKKCEECGLIIPSGAKICPNCGCPVEQQTEEGKKCEECGLIIPSGAKICPNCGCPVEQQTEEKVRSKLQLQQEDSYKTVSELFWSCEFYKVFRGSKFDLAQRIYEVGVLFWEMIKVWWKCFTKKFFTFRGRATRREYFSFCSINVFLLVREIDPILFLIFLAIELIPFLAVSIRRMHDINRRGWWILLPIVAIFFLFKKSDEETNDYGEPSNFI